MTIVTLGRGAITVKDPPVGLKDRLTYWKRELAYDTKRHLRSVKGHYENLYTLSGNVLTTLPGFAHRILEHLRKSGTPYSLVDHRIPLPTPNLELACQGLRDYQLEPVITAITSGGGILSASTGTGKTRMTAAIMRAYDPDQLKLRGTPTIVFAAPDKDINRKNWIELCEVMPDRDIGLVMSGVRKFSDDIQVITLDSLHLLDPKEVGILIVDEVHSSASSGRAEILSSFHNAARWGVSATPTGRFDGGDALLEGLFGPVIYSLTYQDAVRLGALVPIEVYWIKAPPPHIGMTYYSRYKSRDAKIKAAIVNNPDYSKLVADIVRKIPNEMSVICFTQWITQMANIHAHCPEVAYIHAQTKEATGSIGPITPKERKHIYDQMVNGDIRKIFASYVWRQGCNFPALDIVINASGGGSDILAKQIPGRASRKVDGKDKAYMIDFIHEWDWYEDERRRRKPGPLMASDLARKRSYNELGFKQVMLESVYDLPFLKN